LCHNAGLKQLNLQVGDMEMHVLTLKKSTKYWILGSICIIIINLIFFIFRYKVDEILLLWIVMLTPVACLALYPLTRLLDRKEPSRQEEDPV
jgi:hypothetical protein